MIDVRRCRSVAVWAGVGELLVWHRWRAEGCVGLGRYGVRGKKGREFFFFLSEDLWVWGSNGENVIVFR